MKTYGYIATWRSKRVEITLNEGEGGTYRAQQIAAATMGVPPKKSYEVHITLAEIDGKPYIHAAVD